MGPNRRHAAFTLTELLVSVGIVSVLVSLMVPVLIHARKVSYATICQSNLRQIGVGWNAYLQENRDQFPKPEIAPEWTWGGVRFLTPSRTPTIDASRPINDHLMGQPDINSIRVAQIFACPSDKGLGGKPLPTPDDLAVVPFTRFFDTFGTSYRANERLLDPERDYIASNLPVNPSHMLIAGDPVWHFAVADERDDAKAASWHFDSGAGNVLMLDGSVRRSLIARDLGVTLVVTPDRRRTGAP